MITSVATANLYYLPFEQAVDVIAGAGFTDVELALPWKRGPWAMAQHLDGIPARQVAGLLARAGLRVASVHDGGGVLDGVGSTDGYVNPLLREYLDELGYAPDGIVFHTPHIAGEMDDGWWQRTSDAVAQALDAYRACCAWLTIENTPSFDGFTVPLTSPEGLGAFCAAHDLGVTLDTTHYAQMGADVVQAARTLHDRVRTVHLSDYQAGKAHVFVGEGDLDLPGVLAALDATVLRAVTLECAVGFPDEDVLQMSPDQMIGRLRLAKDRVRAWLARIATNASE